MKPPLGRFPSVDPARDVHAESPQSWNKYVYVRNNPLGATDSTGTREDTGQAKYHPNPELDKKLDYVTLKDVGEAAKVVKWGAIASTPLIGATRLAVASAASKAVTAVDVSVAIADPSPKNVGTALVDALQ